MFILFVVVAPLSVTACKFCVANSGAKFVEEFIPLTVEVSTVPLAVKLLLFTAVVVDTTPFTSLVITLPLLDTVLEEITLDVAVTPLIVVVRVLPTRD
jgi:cadmium resistance protein CadD (predicted permease)